MNEFHLNVSYAVSFNVYELSITEAVLCLIHRFIIFDIIIKSTLHCRAVISHTDRLSGSILVTLVFVGKELSRQFQLVYEFVNNRSHSCLIYRFIIFDIIK